MEVAPFDGGYDDSTLSWAQLIGVGVCLLFCSGVGATAMWCLMACWARWHTKRQDLAPKMKEVCKEGDSLPPYPPISEGSGLADRPGELLQLLPKATTTGNSQESRQEGHPAGYGPQSPAGNPGGRGQEELVGPEGGLRFPRRTFLTKLHM